MTMSDPARTVPPAVEFRDVSISFGSFVAVDPDTASQEGTG